VAGSQAKSISFLQDKVASLNRLLGIEVLIEGFPKERDDSHAYMQGLAQLGPRGCVIVVVPVGKPGRDDLPIHDNRFRTDFQSL